MATRPGAAQVAAGLLDAVRTRTAGTDRLLLGLTGPPGAGKSALAHALATAFAALDGEDTAVVVGMDGFHLSGQDLRRRGLDRVKGAPETFDAAGFVALLRRLREAGGCVPAPGFDRDREETVPAAVTVRPEHRLVLVEGNYLLLDGPWAPVRALLHEIWHLHLPDDVRVPGLVARHVAHGRTPDHAREWVLRSDEANARLATSAAHRAHAIVDLTTGALLASHPPHR